MSNRFMISVAALALIAGTGFANAQGGMKGNESGGSTMQQHAAPGGSSAAPSPSESSPCAAKSEASEPKGGMQKGDMKSTQSEKSGAEKSGAMKNQSAQDNAKEKSGSTSQRADDNMKSGNTKTEGRDSKSGTNAAETRDRDNNMKAEGRDGKGGTNAAESKSSTTTTTTGQAGAGAKLTTEQRTKITSVIHSQHVESVKNVNFSINIGTRVPREGVHFYPVPTEVVTIYPQWRGYEFIMVNERIIIIDPHSYEIVEIIES
jgi:Protein of unknown function (DUF1236)